MLGLALGILTFFIVEAHYLNTIYNLEAGFAPGIGLGFVVCIAIEVWLACKDNKLYSPEPDIYRVSTPRAFGLIKRVLKSYYDGNRRWRINYDDRLTGEIHASMHFVDDSYSDMKWLAPKGRVERTINLQIFLTDQKKHGTVIELYWTVDSPLSRADCNLIIRDTSADIHNQLIEAEQAAETKKSRSAI
jgi:hypothetical protein